ncbi:MAG: serine/threonine-protein kinase, partial [Anaeromyxobacteraceae bacterium]
MRTPRDGPGADTSAGEREAAPRGSITALLEELARTPLPPGADEVLALHRAGDTVGRFEIVRELGRGGFGIVYEARDTELGRRVALKAIRPGDAPAAELRKESLRHEAEAAAQLSHPNIVTLHDLTSCDGVPHLILELLDGETLEERLARGPLAPREAVGIAREAAKALAYAHAKGVVHRDLKPSNVFLTEDGRVKVLDFGLAYVFGGRVPLRGGTVAFMAPEVRGDGPVDARADVFALGIVLWQALTGVLPTPGAVPPAADALPAPQRLRDLVARMLADDAAERPSDGAAVLAALEPIERDLSQPSPGAASPPRRRRRRRRLAAGAVALSAMALAAALATRSLARRTVERGAAASARAGSVAVLPFADLSPGHDQAYFAEG